MGNMSYCKFENTEIDLLECLHSLENREALSESERGAARRIIYTFLDFCRKEYIIKDYNSKEVNNVIR